MSLSLIQKDIRTVWRSPVMWLVLAVLSFVAAWMFWQMLDKYISIQINLSALPNPPDITTALWLPYLFTVGKLMTLVVAFSCAMSVAQERSQNTIWYVLINQKSHLPVVIAKFKAQMVILAFPLFILITAAILLHLGGQLKWSSVLFSLLGMVLYLCWLMALGLMISSFFTSTGAAVLMCLLVFGLFWFVGSDTVALEYGVSWMHLFSPGHHLGWMGQGELSLSSLLFFVFGTLVFLWVTALNFKAIKKT